MTIYQPRRDERFEYIGDALDYIEERQCVTCKFREDDPEIPMCLEISGTLMIEEPHPAVVDYGDDGIACKKWEFEA